MEIYRSLDRDGLKNVLYGWDTTLVMRWVQMRRKGEGEKRKEEKEGMEGKGQMKRVKRME